MKEPGGACVGFRCVAAACARFVWLALLSAPTGPPDCADAVPPAARPSLVVIAPAARATGVLLATTASSYGVGVSSTAPCGSLGATIEPAHVEQPRWLVHALLGVVSAARHDYLRPCYHHGKQQTLSWQRRHMCGCGHGCGFGGRCVRLRLWLRLRCRLRLSVVTAVVAVLLSRYSPPKAALPPLLRSPPCVSEHSARPCPWSLCPRGSVRS